MSLINNVGKKITDAGKVAIKASGNMVQITKLNMAIKSEESKIQEYMAEIGNIIFDKYKDGKDIDPDVKNNCEEIEKCIKTIDELKLKIIDIRDLKKCPGCGNEIDKDDVYCSKCGTKSE
ncbi:MAG TPA: zinc ribbon domain-containing protein [Pseudobacteroides sp.]|nr:zinc ribbon domain-containing protein [Pseudobacteroides sp.]